VAQLQGLREQGRDVAFEAGLVALHGDDVLSAAVGDLPQVVPVDVQRVGGQDKVGEVAGIVGPAQARRVAAIPPGSGSSWVTSVVPSGTLRWPMMTPSLRTSAEKSFTLTSGSSSQAPFSTLPSRATAVSVPACPAAARAC
jgi:hypothetical protein